MMLFTAETQSFSKLFFCDSAVKISLMCAKFIEYVERVHLVI